MAFRAYEASDAMLHALQARLGAKQYSALAEEKEREPEVPEAPQEPSSSSSAPPPVVIDMPGAPLFTAAPTRSSHAPTNHAPTSHAPAIERKAAAEKGGYKGASSSAAGPRHRSPTGLPVPKARGSKEPARRREPAKREPEPPGPEETSLCDLEPLSLGFESRFTPLRMPATPSVVSEFHPEIASQRTASGPSGSMHSGPEQGVEVLSQRGSSAGRRPSSAAGRSASHPLLPNSRRSSMESAADKALEKILGSLGQAVVPVGPETELPTKIPSAVTVGGVPVALDGDLVYLGGGLYAATSFAPREQSLPKPKPRALPGRVRAPPRPPGSVVRSASAHQVGPPSGGGDLSPTPSRAQSEGPNGFGETGLTGDSGSRHEEDRKGQPKELPKIWRPSGVGKLPPAPYCHPGTRPSSKLGLGELPGAHLEARALARDSLRREGMALFGNQGLLNQIREAELNLEMSQREVSASAPLGPPQHGAKREAERRAAKEAKVQQMLEERAIRLATEAAAAAAKAAVVRRSAMASASAPELTCLPDEAAPGPKEELQRKKLRVACNMEIVDFFSGYSKAVNRLTQEQVKLLNSKLRSRSDDTDLAVALEELDQKRERQILEWSEKSRKIDDEQSIQRRLRQVNELCNKLFQEPH